MHLKCVSWGVVALLALGTLATAGTINQTDLDGRDASVNWAFVESGGNYFLELVIDNDTPDPANVTYTVTGFSFSILGGAEIDSLVDRSGRLINIDEFGSWTDVGDSGEDTASNWGIGSGSDYSAVNDAVENIVHFTAGSATTAMHAIIGPGDDDDGYLDFVTANDSIKDNPGHNPFVKDTLTLKLLLKDVTATDIGQLSVGDGIIYFGTMLEVNLVPLPTGALMGLALLGAIGAVGLIRRRRRLSTI